MTKHFDRSLTLCAFALLLLALLFASVAEADLIAGKTTVTTSATIIVTAPQRGATYKLQNVSAASVFLGASNVTTANGYELKANGIVDLPAISREKIYGIVAASTSDVHWILMPVRPK